MGLPAGRAAPAEPAAVLPLSSAPRLCCPPLSSRSSARRPSQPCLRPPVPARTSRAHVSMRPAARGPRPGNSPSHAYAGARSGPPSLPPSPPPSRRRSGPGSREKRGPWGGVRRAEAGKWGRLPVASASGAGSVSPALGAGEAGAVLPAQGTEWLRLCALHGGPGRGAVSPAEAHPPSACVPGPSGTPTRNFNLSTEGRAVGASSRGYQEGAGGARGWGPANPRRGTCGPSYFAGETGQRCGSGGCPGSRSFSALGKGKHRVPHCVPF